MVPAILSFIESLSFFEGQKCTSKVDMYRAIYKVCDLIGHFVLASQGLLGHCTFVMEIMS